MRTLFTGVKPCLGFQVDGREKNGEESHGSCSLSDLRQLVDYWLESYDWRAQERFLNAFPQFTTEIDGIHLHFLHVKGKGTHPIPLLISHGWPGCFFEMYKIIGPLTDPASHGGDPADAFDVVVPSLPGYGFSGPTNVRGVTVTRIVEVFAFFMQDLGYQRFAAQGGDWGLYITGTLGRESGDDQRSRKQLAGTASAIDSG